MKHVSSLSLWEKNIVSIIKHFGLSWKAKILTSHHIAMDTVVFAG